VPTYPIVIEHLVVSPGHRYFGRPKDGPGDVPTHDLPRVRVVAGKGLVGDRFFGKAAHLDAAVTLFSLEALEAVADDLDLVDEHGARCRVDPLLTRRNVLLRGVELDPLRGHEFAITSPDGARVLLGGRRPAAPCAWMDRMISPGAHAGLRGRGGLRCEPLGDGELVRGPAVLESPVVLDPARAGVAVLRRLPLP
jgi:MOSC domain-containing protein YiiM